MLKKYCIDPLILEYKTAFMQRLCDAVRTGHSRYIGGQTHITKLPALLAKFDYLYQPFEGRLDASRARKQGLMTSRWIAYIDRPKEPEFVHWFLMIHHDETLRFRTGHCQNELWADALQIPISVTGYELIRLCKPRSDHEKQRLERLQEALKSTNNPQEQVPILKAIDKLKRFKQRPGNGHSWTWRYQKDRHNQIMSEIVRLIRNGHDRELKTLITQVYRSPGFAGCRMQVRKWRDLIYSEWKRRRSGEIAPQIPRNIGYVQRLPSKGIKASHLLKQHHKISQS